MAVGCQYFCGFDLASAFWSIPIKKEHCHLTAFVMLDNLKYEWTRTPFGLMTSPQLMQTLMNTATEGIRDFVRSRGRQRGSHHSSAVPIPYIGVRVEVF